MTHNKIIDAFSADHVVKLTGLSKRQLRYWDDTVFFQPHYAAENRRSPHSRVYSFRDVVGLRAIAILRKEHNCALQHLRKVAEELTQYTETPWADITLYVLGKEVYFREPETEQVRGIVNKQYINIPLRAIMQDVEKEAKKLTKRQQDQIGYVDRKRYRAHNAWVVAGTRIPTKAIRDFKEAGFTTDQIIREYPSLTRRDIEAALDHEEKLAHNA